MENSAVDTITREELEAKLARRDAFVLFEVLPTPYWRKHHLPGALNMPPAAVAQTVVELGIGHDADIVLYCWDDD